MDEEKDSEQQEEESLGSLNQKTDSQAKRMTLLVLPAVVLQMLITGVISYILLSMKFNGQISSATGLTLLIITQAIMAAFVSVAVARIFGKIAAPLSDVSKQLISLSKGSMQRFEMRRTRAHEINDVEVAAETMVDYLSRYIADIDSTLERIAKGDLDFQVTGEYVGDFAQIKTSMNHIIDELNRMMGSMGKTSGKVLTISEQVSSSSQALAQGATEQAGTLEELLSTINGISGQVNETAGSAEQANSRVDAVRSEITRSNEQMQTLINAMGDISDTSNQVAKIVKIIQDIAFQTNILALNAAVEAARAGANGKSFAVVADEVKNLATKSASAADDTTRLIKNTISAVENGMNISKETADLLSGVVDSVNDMAGIVSSISNAAVQESTAINQVVQGLDQVSTVVQTNSASAEESAAVSHDLASAAQKLDQTVSSLKLRK
jgi:Methyl-accepting chemotaxis protein